MKAKDFTYLTVDQAEKKHGSAKLELGMEQFELNICDRCTIIDYSKDLYWPEYMELSTKEYMKVTKNGKYTAICDDCYKELKGK